LEQGPEPVAEAAAPAGDRLVIGAALLLMLGTAAPPAAAAPVQSAQADWTRRVEMTAEGGYRMGNPEAPVKLVEYASITCSHCADFNNAAAAGLRGQVRTGRVSWEVRPFLIFPTDPAIFRLLQCKGAATFFDISDELYAQQRQWIARIVEGEEVLKTLPTPQLEQGLVRVSGVGELFGRHGMTEQQIAACLADQPALVRLNELTQRYTRSGVTGTPTFLINGREVQVPNWAALQAMLTAAGGS
jgi:protein-disulfide isomerase